MDEFISRTFQSATFGRSSDAAYCTNKKEKKNEGVGKTEHNNRLCAHTQPGKVLHHKRKKWIPRNGASACARMCVQINTGLVQDQSNPAQSKESVVRAQSRESAWKLKSPSTLFPLACSHKPGRDLWLLWCSSKNWVCWKTRKRDGANLLDGRTHSVQINELMTDSDATEPHEKES